jgi:glutamyl-tRNA reductase
MIVSSDNNRQPAIGNNFMSIVLIGLNHKTAPVALRERLAFSELACTDGLRSLVDGEIVQEGLIVSTCNRVEILAATATENFSETEFHIKRFFSKVRNISLSDFAEHLYAHNDDEAVRHIFRVASSLDSLVVGEAQILGQVRKAYSQAVEVGTAGRVLNRLIHHAFHVAKRVRTETGIAANAVSISYMAVELGRKIFDSLKDKTVMLVGAGEMAELAAKHLINAGATKVLVVNRTFETAERLAGTFGGEVIHFDSLSNRLHEADIVICSTGASDFVITQSMAREALQARRNRPAFFIDISVPRNVDPMIADISNLFVFDVDDLEAVVKSNIREREKESQRAELIVESEVMQFQQNLRTMDIGPSIGAIRGRMQNIARAEFSKQKNRLNLTPEQEEAVEKLLLSTVNKISHPVMQGVRNVYDSGDEANVKSLLESFGLE